MTDDVIEQAAEVAHDAVCGCGDLRTHNVEDYPLNVSFSLIARALADEALLAVPGEPCEHLQPQPADPFMQDLAELLHRHGKQSRSDTAHFVLAQYLVHSLEAFDYATRYARSVAAIQQNNAGEAS